MNELPAWDHSTEYQGLQAADFQRDLDQVKKNFSDLEATQIKWASLLANYANPEADESFLQGLRDFSKLVEETTILLYNLSTLTVCETAVDSSNEVAEKIYAEIEVMSSQLQALEVPLNLFLIRCPESFLQKYLNTPKTQSQTFYWRHQRLFSQYLLSEKEEQLLRQMTPFSLHSWSNLYRKIADSLKIQMPSQGVVSLAKASGFARSSNELHRREAWDGIQAAWQQQEIPCAEILNNIAGYRIELAARRSLGRKTPQDCLDVSLQNSRVHRGTLDAMWTALHQRLDIPQRALAAMGRLRGQSLTHPADLSAPSPLKNATTVFSFQEAIALIRESFASLDPAAGEFIDTMVKNRWIEARVLPHKKQGAFCIGYLKSGNPRVFQTFMGSWRDVNTLAHELGHAYHTWVLKDIPLYEGFYPTTVAETASIFAETLLAEKIRANAKSEDLLNIGWAEAENAVNLLANVPSRFDFEMSFYKAREQGPLNAKELNALMDQAWRYRYGSQLSQTEPQFWMCKHHFSSTYVTFYNYHYTFGYLFSLGIFAMKEKWGADFHPAYLRILRDSGRCTVEDLVQNHLGADVGKPDFWLASLEVVDRKISQFESLVAKH